MERYSFNKVRFALGLGVLLWLGWATVQDNRELTTNRHEVAIELLLTIGLASLLVWLLSVRIDLNRHGATYRSLTGSRQMHWRNLTKVYASWRQRYLAQLIPWYRAYRIELTDRQGNSLVFGNRFQNADSLAQRVLELSGDQLRAGHLAAFQAGKTVDFGALSLSPQGGVTIAGQHTVPWSEIVSYELTDSELAFVLRRGQAIVLPLRRVSLPNVCATLIASGLGLARKPG